MSIKNKTIVQGLNLAVDIENPLLVKVDCMARNFGKEFGRKPCSSERTLNEISTL